MDRVGLPEGVALVQGEGVLVTEKVARVDEEGDLEGVLVAEVHTETERHAEEDPVLEEASEGVEGTLGVGEWVGEMEAERLRVGEAEEVGQRLGVTVAVKVGVREVLGQGEEENEDTGEGESDAVVLDEREALEQGEGEGE